MGFNIDIRNVDVGGETFEHFMFRAANQLKKYIEYEYFTLTVIVFLGKNQWDIISTIRYS